VFLNDKPEMKLLQTADGQAFVSYLTDIFEKLNMLNKQLQGANKTLVDSKAKISGFIAFLQLCQKNVCMYMIGEGLIRPQHRDHLSSIVLHVKRMFQPKNLMNFIG
jgi:hypothetical protein